MSISTFFEKIVDAFESIFGSNNWEKTASTTLNVVGPLIESIVTLTDNEADADEIAQVISTVQTDLTTISNLISSLGNVADSTSTIAEIVTILNAIKTNLAALLTAGQIKNPATLTQVESIVNMVINEIEAILAAVPTN